MMPSTFRLAVPVTGVVDGTAEQDVFLQFAPQFHSGWPHILLVGCRFGYAYLVHLDIREDDTISSDGTDADSKTLRKMDRSDPVKAKKTVPLSKIFYEDEMFCSFLDKVFVSALTYIEKSKLVVVGFNFGGMLIISLKTSKVISLLYIEGSVKYFALQEPEEDPRPILFFWVCINVVQKGPVVILLSINFPKDEAATKDPAEYTFEEPVFIPSMKWYPDSCSQMVSMRTLLIQKNKISGNGSEDFDELDETTSTLKMRNTGGSSVMHGSLFDLNAYYAKRLVGRVTVDATLAKQMHFFSRFSSTESFSPAVRGLLDVSAYSINRFAAPAFLKDSIDQLYYPSVYHITANCLSDKRFVQVMVRPIQIQLIANISENIENYFQEPREPCNWVCAIGLANSVPATNSNEEKACLLRVLVHNYFPGVLKLVEASSTKPEVLRFIQRWAWKEVEMTKSKFDDMCAPLFAVPPLELSPSARGFIHHARVFFKRASLTLECVSAKILAMDDEEWQDSINIQHQATRQVRFYAYGVAFGMCFKLLPNDARSSKLFEQVVVEFTKRYEKLQVQGKQMKIHEIVAEAMDLESENHVWEKKNAEEWFPPNSYSCFLPVLLMMEVSELTKLTMLCYYCLDIETFAEKEEFALEVMNQIRKIWLEDRQLASMDLEMLRDGNGAERSVNESDLKWLPLSCPEEVDLAKAEYLKLDYGIFKFNLNVIEKRRFNLIVEPPPPSTVEEPDFVVSCRAQCKEIAQRFPWIFKKVEGLPQFVLEKYHENAVKENMEHENFLRISSRKRPLPSQIQLNVRHINGAVPGFNGDREVELPCASRYFGGSRHLDAKEQDEMDNSLQRQRLMLFPPTPVAQPSSSFRACTEVKKAKVDQNIRSAYSEKKFGATSKRNVKAKDMDRVNKLIQTPVSLSKSMSRIPVRRAGGSSRLLFSGTEEATQTPTHPSSPMPTPTSILKRAQRRSRLISTAKPRLRFATEHKTEQIPSRAEKLIEEGNDTSFSTFAVLSSTESSNSSLAQLDDSLDACRKVESTPVSDENECVLPPNFEVQTQPISLTPDHNCGGPRLNQSIEEQGDEDMVEEKGEESGLVFMKSMEEQEELDTVAIAGAEDALVHEIPILKEKATPEAKNAEGPKKGEEKKKTPTKKTSKASSEVDEGTKEAREWVNAHLRRSSRMRSPLKSLSGRTALGSIPTKVNINLYRLMIVTTRPTCQTPVKPTVSTGIALIFIHYTVCDDIYDVLPNVIR
uniref:Uncharacterized protein n=1 Tax=Ditylenchus dipsaci TaxID=166011 RepID=A0A915CSW0_9BILA